MTLARVPVGSYCTVMHRGQEFRIHVTGKFEQIVWARYRGKDGWTEGPLPFAAKTEVIGPVMGTA